MLPPRSRSFAKLKSIQDLHLDHKPSPDTPLENTNDSPNNDSDSPTLASTPDPILDLTIKPVKAKRKRKRTARKRRATPPDSENESDGTTTPRASGVHKAKKPKSTRRSSLARRAKNSLSSPQSQSPSPTFQQPTSLVDGEPERAHSQGDAPSSETLPTSPSNTPAAVDNNPPLSPEAMSRCISLLLDLLGWDVPPEYIVDSGFSLSSILYLFARLRLRLTPGLVERAQSANIPLPPYSILPESS